MNNARRKELNEALELIYQAQDIINSCKDDEEMYRDNMPENLQGSEKYERADEVIDALQEAVDGLDEVIGKVEEAAE